MGGGRHRGKWAAAGGGATLARTGPSPTNRNPVLRNGALPSRIPEESSAHSRPARWRWGQKPCQLSEERLRVSGGMKERWA